MSLFLVRHAKAGKRSAWDGDDRLRPLSEAGWAQAERIAEHLRTRAPSGLWSSPYMRCRQTLEPLALALDLDIGDEPRLAEATPFEKVLDLLAEVDDGAVLCSHGDIIPDVVAAIERRGADIATPPDWRKGTVWAIERTAAGEFVSAAVWAP